MSSGAKRAGSKGRIDQQGRTALAGGEQEGNQPRSHKRSLADLREIDGTQCISLMIALPG
jgi:hypothetical protein